ncbi:MAG: cyclic nucleotide-binding domain-containing protein [Acidobacteriota bacterium]
MSSPVFKTTSGGTGGASGSGGAPAPVPVKKTAAGYILELSEGDYVFREGELGTEMYIIHEGKVEILSGTGSSEQLLSVLEKGDFFGEMSILEDLPRAASARAVTDVKLLQINGSTFDQLLRNNPEIAVRMMRKLARRLRETDELLRSSTEHRQAALSVSREMPRMNVQVPGEGPERLLHGSSGMEFPLATGAETTVGRKDAVTGIYPDIDLSPLDQQRSISRRHAKIYRRGGKFFVGEEIGTMNSTFVNGARLETGVPSEIRNGDEVRFGVVALKFQVP